MAETVDQKGALEALERAWRGIKSKTRPPARMHQLIEQVLGATDVTFKYILVTGYLAKCLNPSINARAIQVSSKLKGAYDARSLCHGVVVGFEKNKGNLFGLSNEPFVNKPARHPEHDGKNPQLRNKLIAQKLHDCLEMANTATARDVKLGLVHILRIGAAHAANQKEVIATAKVNLKKASDFLELFLQEADGGSRLVAVWGAFMSLISEHGKVSVTPPNVSDQFGKTAGDVEIRYDGTLVAASECKHRPLNLDDVKHGIRKAIESGVPEYHFVIADRLANGQEQEISDEIENHADELDLLLVDIWGRKNFMAGILNPVRRTQLGPTIVRLLREMKKFESANVAAERWNLLKD